MSEASSEPNLTAIDFSQLENMESNLQVSWKDSICGQCDFARFLTEEMRIRAGGLGTPTMIDCWFNPPQIVCMPTAKGPVMMPPAFPRMPAIHPACGQFVYSAASQDTMQRQEEARSAVKEPKPFNFIRNP